MVIIIVRACTDKCQNDDGALAGKYRNNRYDPLNSDSTHVRCSVSCPVHCAFNNFRVSRTVSLWRTPLTRLNRPYVIRLAYPADLKYDVLACNIIIGCCYPKIIHATFDNGPPFFAIKLLVTDHSMAASDNIYRLSPDILYFTFT